MNDSGSPYLLVRKVSPISLLACTKFSLLGTSQATAIPDISLEIHISDIFTHMSVVRSLHSKICARVHKILAKELSMIDYRFLVVREQRLC